ncbi:unnamed protein product [Nesidiocoris tenuis]|uniref:Cytosol aminopeptidase n=1 Tax=Nesidiocoris tenuis TaxID=355587 RepID=A0A6H5FWY2_9HEMI|nr:unnamed protein product [Nesidiocoris tenuis]
MIIVRILTKSVQDFAKNGARFSSAAGKINHAWAKDFEMPSQCIDDSQGAGKALILGIYGPAQCAQDESNALNSVTFTATAHKYNDYSCLELYKQLKASGARIGLGEARAFFNVDPAFPITILVGLGNQCYGYNRVEQRDEAKEAVRLAVGAGCQAVQNLGANKVFIESFGITEAAAEGACLALWMYQDLKNKNKRKKIPHIGLYDDCDWTAWQVGLEKAASQNLARQMMEAPGNLMTPLLFTMTALDELCKTGISAEVRVENWIVENRMDAFLAVSKGSYEQPIFLELVYNGCDPCTPPIVMVGKGITYDAGGLCLKRDTNECLVMKGDMAGAAMVVASMRANMPGAGAFKPGDIVRAMNGKNIIVENTDLEGQLILADALSYSLKYNPKFIMDIASLTQQSQHLLGSAATSVFTNDDNLWTSMKAASIHTGDRVWRLPLWEAYLGHVESENSGADLTNWIHLDTYAVMYENGDTTYLRKGMSGRPTRTIVEMLAMLACKPTDC